MVYDASRKDSTGLHTAQGVSVDGLTYERDTDEKGRVVVSELDSDEMLREITYNMRGIADGMEQFMRNPMMRQMFGG